MGIKKGTKLTDKPKNNMLRIRVDDETLGKLDAVCDKTKKTRSEIIRNSIEEQYERVKK